MTERARITVRGAVQGVGFRPFIYRLAVEKGLTGWVLNSSQGVFIEAEGDKPLLDRFILDIEDRKPPRSFIQSLEFSFLDPIGFTRFEIRHSDDGGETTALVLPDIAACPDCLSEIFDTENRRHLYPFTNCTNCGPRYTIIESLPYDRPNTTMKRFEMCADCREEYHNPLDRRFHAQPNGCPACGPHIELWDETGRPLSTHHWALLEASAAIREGRIVAVKGLGGFHLMADARNEEAVARLRRRKHREEKPFATMYPSLDAVKAHCDASDLEARLLRSPESPIVLLRRRSLPPDAGVARSVAPRNPYLGIMLPYTPLHQILMTELGFPIVATSGNLTDEPICTDEQEAVERLRGVADLFLVHDRPIRRSVDDSVVRVMMGRELVIRRARGYAPLPIQVQENLPPLLSVGGHLKNTVAITAGSNIFISQHIGDLETVEAYEAFRTVIESLKTLYRIRPERILCDLHPDYLSTAYARETGTDIVAIQHHHAHVASCMAENRLTGPVLGVAWDGTGYGTDGTIWGGEFLWADETAFQRVGCFRRFRLAGGEAAVKEPRRAAAGLLYEIFGDALFGGEGPGLLGWFTETERPLLRRMLSQGFRSPWTTSAGRLFDGVGSLTGLRQRVSFEGQAAMELEFAIADEQTEEGYPFEIQESSLQIADWKMMIVGILDDLKRGVTVGRIASKFHNTLVEMILEVALRIGEPRVVLTGGCFQNRYLTERAVRRLTEEGFRPYRHQRIPPNDGGIALGQVYAAIGRLRKERVTAVARLEEQG
jgi:hydrogenase maturation protein HypF